MQKGKVQPKKERTFFFFNNHAQQPNNTPVFFFLFLCSSPHRSLPARAPLNSSPKTLSFLPPRTQSTPPFCTTHTRTRNQNTPAWALEWALLCCCFCCFNHTLPRQKQQRRKVTTKQASLASSWKRGSPLMNGVTRPASASLTLRTVRAPKNRRLAPPPTIPHARVFVLRFLPTCSASHLNCCSASNWGSPQSKLCL